MARQGLAPRPKIRRFEQLVRAFGADKNSRRTLAGAHLVATLCEKGLLVTTP